MTINIRFRDDFWRRVCWSKGEDSQPKLCSCCAGALTDVPLVLWRENGSRIAVCDPCIEKFVEVK